MHLNQIRIDFRLIPDLVTFSESEIIISESEIMFSGSENHVFRIGNHDFRIGIQWCQIYAFPELETLISESGIGLA